MLASVSIFFDELQTSFGPVTMQLVFSAMMADCEGVSCKYFNAFHAITKIVFVQILLCYLSTT